MKRKFLSSDEYKKALPPSGISFATISPFQLISLPSDSLFCTLAGKYTPTSTPSLALGTLQFCRYDQKDSMPLNFYSHIVYSTGTPSILELVAIKPEYHWSNNLPAELGTAAPTWVNEIINLRLNKNEN